MVFDATLAIAAAVAVFVIILMVKGFKIVQQAETMVIERLGKYNRTLESGINIIWPVFDKPRKVMWRYTESLPDGTSRTIHKETMRMDLRETVFDFPRQNVITKDNVHLAIDALLYFQIVDPSRAAYEVGNLPLAIEKLTQTTLRNVLGELDLDECLTSRDTINRKLRAILDEATDKWGVKITRVELQDISPPADVQEAMEKQMRAERDRRAKILEAEGEKRAAILQAEGQRESDINQAEGEKQAAILQAQGEAEARVKVAEAEAEAIRKITAAIESTGSDPVSYLVAMRYIDTLREMVSGQDNKTVYLPYEATGVLSSLGGMKDLFSGQAKA